MSCYHPLTGRYIGLNANGKRQYNIETAWNGIKHHPLDIPVPCGQCIGCRLDRSRQWADRMMLELDHTGKAIFVTLTYRPEDVPVGMYADDGSPIYTLDKRDFQLFMKRLRKFYTGKEIRFFACGEYGDKTFRPHYHCILFGLDLSDISDLYVVGRGCHGEIYYSSPDYERIWSHGLLSIASVSWQVCAYVARYCTKKLTGAAADFYAECNILAPFSLMSRRPGIGGYFNDEHDISSGTIFLSDLNGITPRNKISLPKYNLSKLELTNPVLYDKISTSRKRFASDRMLLELSKTDLGLPEYLAVKEANFKSRILLLSRDKN